MTIKIIFLDRDGVINQDIGYLHKIEDCKFINGVFKACQYFKSLGYQIAILDVFHCPHSPKSNCNCRKPKPGMFFSAKNKYNIDMEKSWMIGDSERDIRAANLAGIKKTIMVRSGHVVNKSKSNAMFFLDSIDQANQIIN